MATNPKDLPDYKRPEAQALCDQLQLIDRLRGGTPLMHKAAKQYIHQWDGEDDTVFMYRSKIEPLFEGLGKTIGAGVGLMFIRPPQINWGANQTVFETQFKNIDGMGTSMQVFSKRFSSEALADGLGGILVDFTPNPRVNGVDVNAGNEKMFGLRPLWAKYKREQIINWRTATVQGEKVFTLLVLKEESEEADGLYGIKPVCKYRVLRLDGQGASWTLYRENKNIAGQSSFSVDGSGYFRNRTGDVAPRIPFSISYTGHSLGPMHSTIPLLGVAYANLAHWQLSTDLRFYRSLAAFPQPTVVGDLMDMQQRDPATGALALVPGRLRIGPAVAVHLKENGDFKWVELQGTAMAQLEHGIDEKKKDMATQGMSFLFKEMKNAPETATSKRIDSMSEQADLATCAQGLEDGVNSAMKWHAWYEGIDEASAPTASINRDFQATMLEPTVMQAYINAAKDIGFPVRALLDAWKAGGRIAEDTDLDELEQEMVANQAAEQAQKAVEAAAQAANGGNPLPGQ